MFITLGMPSIFADALDIVILILTFGFVIFLAYFSLRLMGRARGIKNSSNMKVVEAIGVGFQNSVQLLRAGDKYFIIGVSRTGITLIGEVDASAITEEMRAMPEMSFDKYLSKFLKKDKGGQDDNKDGE